MKYYKSDTGRGGARGGGVHATFVSAPACFEAMPIGQSRSSSHSLLLLFSPLVMPRRVFFRRLVDDS